jgi:signal transduction histidine kinase
MGAQHPKMEVGYRVDGEETVSLVRDNGIGIGANELFYHVDNSINKGTGAGPAIVKRIVVAPGSHIGVEQKHEKAARFVLRCRFTLRLLNIVCTFYIVTENFI